MVDQQEVSADKYSVVVGTQRLTIMAKMQLISVQSVGVLCLNLIYKTISAVYVP